ncbi:gfo/Idh/MocA family oxidoreductase [Agrobacterium vitis]|uniref:Gfo/Idh/MocA family protein n=1 Tax=Agrobacterium vitis TaxID=373 RepID=UPI0012E8D8F7|nr:Gfo/Idh/MocA family oxidoreductase [Agrobacterium vitis]MVA71023.1 gfo/Idh/MocA family oxidoreductase [Agrobacterium vitis]
MKKLKWGVLGTANIAMKAVIPAIQAGETGIVAAIASRSLAKAQSVAADLGITKAYGSYEELLRDPDIDAIYNPLPNHLHMPMTLEAIRHGKPVLCEKPIALTAKEAMQIASASHTSGVLVAEAFMVRHHPQWLKVRDLVKAGQIGEVRAIQTIFSYYLDDPANVRNQKDIGGGGLYDVGCYAINTARFVFDGEPERVIGLFDQDETFQTDRMMSGLAEFSAGRHLTFTCATQLSLCQKVTVLGTNGRIEIAIPFNAPTDAPTTITIDDGRDLTGGGCEVIEISAANQYGLQCDAFAHAVLVGEPLLSGLGDAVANMKVIDAFFRSAKSNGWEQP